MHILALKDIKGGIMKTDRDNMCFPGMGTIPPNQMPTAPMMPPMSPMPNMYPVAGPPSGGMSELANLDNRVMMLERQVKRLETRVSRLETPYSGSQPSYQPSLPPTYQPTSPVEEPYSYPYQTSMQMM
jgi:hypothetical protein